MDVENKVKACELKKDDIIYSDVYKRRLIVTKPFLSGDWHCVFATDGKMSYTLSFKKDDEVIRVDDEV